MLRDMRVRVIFFDERLSRIIFLLRMGIAIWLPGTVAGAAELLRMGIAIWLPGTVAGAAEPFRIVLVSPPSRASDPLPDPPVLWAKTGPDSSIKAAAQYRVFFMWSFLLFPGQRTVRAIWSA